MNKDAYTLENYLALKKKVRLSFFFSLGLLLFGAAFTLLSGLYITRQNQIVIRVADGVVTSLCLCLSFYFFLEVFLPSRERQKFLYKLLAVSRYEGTIKIISISCPTIVKKAISAYEIVAIDDEEKEKTYYLESIYKIDFCVGDSLQVVIADGFITSYSLENSNE